MIGGKTSLLLLTLIVGGIMIAVLVPAAYADEEYILNQDYQRVNSNIIIHLIEVNVTDKPMGNVYPSAAPSETKWAHLVFNYENIGDASEKGYINMEFVDSNGNTYPNTEIRDATVAPHTTTDRPLFTEVPIPKNATLTKLHVYQGTNPAFRTKEQWYDLHMTVVATPTPVVATPTPTAASPTGCLGALLPFALLSSLGVAGIAIRKYGLNK
jgi:hypothetical protein